MIKGMMCVVIGIVVGLGLYAMGVPDPIPPIMAGVTSATLTKVVQHE